MVDKKVVKMTALEEMEIRLKWFSEMNTKLFWVMDEAVNGVDWVHHSKTLNEECKQLCEYLDALDAMQIGVGEQLMSLVNETSHRGKQLETEVKRLAENKGEEYLQEIESETCVVEYPNSKTTHWLDSKE